MYGRQLEDRVVEFGHEGVLYRNSFIMYDRETLSLWVHTTGECVKGELEGRQLQFLSSVVTTWGNWKNTHPNSLVLEGEQASGFMGTFALSPDRTDDFGLSVGQNESTKLYPIEDLRRLRLVQDRVGEHDVVIFFDRAGLHGTAWLRGDHQFHWDGDAFVDAEDRPWDMMLGQPIGSAPGGENMQPLPATVWLIEKWLGFYPQSEVFEAPPLLKSKPHLY